jgi:hypothetical protein
MAEKATPPITLPITMTVKCDDDVVEAVELVELEVVADESELAVEVDAVVTGTRMV